jgi:cytosine/adenosine deaminase-related metal-dependent hydrolase
MTSPTTAFVFRNVRVFPGHGSSYELARYPGALGTVEAGTWADLLLVDGDPLADISLLARPDESLAVIMKHGVVHKNLLA